MRGGVSGIGQRRPHPYRRKCARCGEEFVHDYPRRRYCSPECASAEMHERAVRTYPPRSEAVRLYVEERLTDRELGRRFGRSYNWALKVRKHYGIPGRRGRARPKPLSKRSDRQRWTLDLKPEAACRNCGDASGALHLHHAVPRSLNSAGRYDLRNGVALCIRCHLGWHNHRCQVPRDIFTAEEWEFICTLIGDDWLAKRYPLRSAIDNGPRLCQRGHEMEGYNVIESADGKRRCRTCANLRAAEYRARRRMMRVAS